jgi:hypothetical protein
MGFNPAIPAAPNLNKSKSDAQQRILLVHFFDLFNPHYP